MNRCLRIMAITTLLFLEHSSVAFAGMPMTTLTDLARMRLQTISFFLLMFPGFWYAGKPIGMGIGPVYAVIWKFFAASVGAGCLTFLIISSMPRFAAPTGASGAFVRMVSVSLVFFGLYFLGVIALHGGLKPLAETVNLLRDLLPQRMLRREATPA